MPGTLFVVATPIGNLEDITLRALRVLRQVSRIAAEDTRRTAGLLAHFDIHTPTISYHAHNERHRTAELIGMLQAGDDIALVSDAGTPLVSDPGAQLVSAARAARCPVEVVPGPSALLTALVATGWALESFSFLGFPPRPARQKTAWIKRVATESHAAVFFEAPHRITDTLRLFADVLPDRPLALARELTKVHEQILVGTAATLLEQLEELRGEFTVVVSPPPDELDAFPQEISDAELWREFCSLTEDAGTDRRAAISLLGRRYGRAAREIYAALERFKSATRST